MSRTAVILLIAAALIAGGIVVLHRMGYWAVDDVEKVRINSKSKIFQVIDPSETHKKR